jgi:hypothetical protein
LHLPTSVICARRQQQRVCRDIRGNVTRTLRDPVDRDTEHPESRGDKPYARLITA